MFIAVLSTKDKRGKQPWCPLAYEQISKTWYMCTMEDYSSLKKDRTF
jgi:hypothetical protein